MYSMDSISDKCQLLTISLCALVVIAGKMNFVQSLEGTRFARSSLKNRIAQNVKKQLIRV